jgi:DNA-binding response OmpR family regulator
MNAASKVADEPLPASPPAILVVEDDVLIRAVIAGYLRDCSFEIVEAGDADEAIRVMQAGQRFDVVFSDINMPGSLNGLDLARWVRRERPGIKLILTSGLEIKPPVDLRENGPILAKPYAPAELARRIRALLSR